MKAGSLNSLVEIKQKEAVQDEAGQVVDDWTTFASVWANILHRNGIEAIRADADTSVVRASVRIRRLAGIKAGMRVHYDDVVYDIEAVLPDVKKVFVDLTCRVVS
jgi:SPP1 family predicted phage head-tail adaptor